MTTDQALLKITAATAHAVEEALRVFCGDRVSAGAGEVVPEGTSPLDGVALPTVLTRVAYVDGVTGGNLFTMPIRGAQLLAAAMMGAEEPTLDTTELDAIQLSAVGEAMNQMMSAAAQAVGRVLGQEVEIGPPDTARIAALDEARDFFPESGAQCTTVEFMVLGVPCRLVQVLPHAFVMRLTRAMDEILTEHHGAPLKAAMTDVVLRAWVELGRTRMPLGRFVTLPPGEVLALDREADDLVDLYVDGMCLARGRLLVSDDGQALSLEVVSVLGAGPPEAFSPTTRQPEGVNT